MFQGIRELKVAKGRTALIIATITLITVLVTFLSSLAAGLSFQSVSALQNRMNPEQALVLEESGSSTLSSSRLSPEQIDAVENSGGETLFMARTRVGEKPAILFSDATLHHGQARLPEELSGGKKDLQKTLPALESVETTETTDYFDHLPVIAADPAVVAALPGASSGGIVEENFTLDSAPEGLQMLEGKDRWNASSSYAGEQMSLNLMIKLLYVISALVLGAFFTVWTLQRLRGVTISAALGASRRVLISDAIGQAFLVLLVGIGLGALITWTAATFIGGGVPVVLSASTLAFPAAVLAIAGLLGSGLSLKPVLSVEPRAALATA